MASVVGRRYSNALYSLALEEGQIENIKENSDLVIKSLKGNEEFEDIIKHPRISNKEKEELINKVFNNELHETLKGLISILIKKGRSGEIINTLEMYNELVKKHNNIIDAKIVSSVKLSEERIEQIKDKLSNNLNKEVQVEVEIDESLIGGLLIRVDGRIIDGTIKKRLEDIRSGLLNNDLVNLKLT